MNWKFCCSPCFVLLADSLWLIKDDLLSLPLIILYDAFHLFSFFLLQPSLGVFCSVSPPLSWSTTDVFKTPLSVLSVLGKLLHFDLILIGFSFHTYTFTGNLQLLKSHIQGLHVWNLISRASVLNLLRSAEVWHYLGWSIAEGAFCVMEELSCGCLIIKSLILGAEF